jgi:hypothetical protein
VTHVTASAFASANIPLPPGYSTFPRGSLESHGGAATGKASPNFDLGTIGNIISGLVGGGVLGQIVTLALPSVVAAAETGHLSVGGVISLLIAGGAGGAILTAIVGAIKNKAMA